MPANYEVFTSQIAGVQAGSAGSLQIINEVLYYKGREGVYAYTGSTPQLISAKLAPVEYGEAVAGHTGTSYVKRQGDGSFVLATSRKSDNILSNSKIVEQI